MLSRIKIDPTKAEEQKDDKELNKEQYQYLSEMLALDFEAIIKSELNLGTICLYLNRAIDRNSTIPFNDLLDKLYQPESQNQPSAGNIELIRALKNINDLYHDNFICPEKNNCVKEVRALDYFLKPLDFFQFNDVRWFIKSKVQEKIAKWTYASPSSRTVLEEEIARRIQLENSMQGNDYWRYILDLPLEQMIPGIYEPSSDPVFMSTVLTSQEELNPFIKDVESVISTTRKLLLSLQSTIKTSKSSSSTPSDDQKYIQNYIKESKGIQILIENGKLMVQETKKWNMNQALAVNHGYTLILDGSITLDEAKKVRFGNSTFLSRPTIQKLIRANKLSINQINEYSIVQLSRINIGCQAETAPEQILPPSQGLRRLSK